MSFESPQRNEKVLSTFIFPNLTSEQGEIMRTAREFAKEDGELFLEKFNQRAKESVMIPITKDMWSKLENTDSYDIKKGDWEKVRYHAVEGNPDAPRDWETLKSKLERGEQIDAPIICEKGGVVHLVSGNTRLMVSRALGVEPMVLMVRMGEKENIPLTNPLNSL